MGPASTSTTLLKDVANVCGRKDCCDIDIARETVFGDP